MARVLLTGGAGFIGSSVARALLERGDEVVVLDKLTYAGRREHLEGLDLELVVGDICDAPLVARLISGMDAVVHLAAESHVTRSIVDASPFIRTNIEGTRVIVEAAVEAGVERIVHMSTDEVFGSACSGEAFGVDDPHAPSNAYAASKSSAEAIIQSMRHTHGARVNIVRCTNNYGPRQHLEKAIPCWASHAIAEEPIPIHGDGTAQRDWLHVGDMARGIAMILDGGELDRTYHFSGGTSLPNRSVAEKIAEICGGGEVFSEADRPGQDRRYALDDSYTREVLGWRPLVEFSRGLEETVEWYRGTLDVGGVNDADLSSTAK